MIYFLDGNQEVIKIARSSAVISAIQTQELPENNSLMIDRLSVQLKNDERLFDAQYMAIKSYKGNRNSFDMYRIVTEVVPDATTEFEGVQVAPYELEGVMVEDLRPKNRTVEYVAEQILADSDWRVGYVDDNLPTVTTNFYYLSAKDSLKKLQELTGVEFTFKVEISGNKITDKWVEIYRELGNRTLKRFNYGTNALTVKRETNHSELYTALIGRGKGEETESGGHGRKITFKDVVWSKSSGNPVDKPAGQKYIELPEATSLYGMKQLDGTKKPRIGLVEFTETEDPDVLIKETWEALQYYARPKVLFSATVANIGDTGIGDAVTIHRHDLNMHYKTRVRKVVRDRKNNDYTQVDIGDVVHTPSTKRQGQINSALNNVADDLENVRDEVTEARRSANGKNTNFYGNVEPERKKVGDTWFRDHPSLTGESQILVWNGEAWELIMDTSETTKNADAIAEQQQEIEEAKQTADEAVEQIDTAVSNAGFTSLDETISSVQSISNQAQTNANTAIDDAFEAMQQASQAVDNTGSLNVRVDDVENTLSVKADKQTVDDLTGVVDSQTLDIQANAEGLALKANQDTVDTLTGTVQILGSEFDVVAGQISSKVWNTDIETAIDGIEVGGRNLVLNTKGKLYRTFGSGATLSEVDDATRLDWTGSTQTSMGEKISVPLTIGETYTLTFEARGTISPEIELYILTSSGPNLKFSSALSDKVTTEEFKKYTATFKFTGSPSDRLYIGGRGPTGTWLEVKDSTVKLEKGNTATDWTPAPEDTDAKIDHIETEFTQTFDSFSQTVAGIDGRVTSQEQTIDSISSTVSGHGDRISTVEQTASGLQSTVADKANRSEVTQLSDLLSSTVEDVEGNTTQISQLADNINLRVEKDDVINQINISDENILIQSENILLDGDVTVRGTAWMDGAVIANASIDGAKIQDATIGSAKIANIDANKITTGELKGIRAEIDKGLIGGWSLMNDRIYKRTPYGYTILKPGGDVALATASPQNTAAGGAVFQLYHDGRMSFLNDEGVYSYVRPDNGGELPASVRGLAITSNGYIYMRPGETLELEGRLLPNVNAKYHIGERNRRYKNIFSNAFRTWNGVMQNDSSDNLELYSGKSIHITPNSDNVRMQGHTSPYYTSSYYLGKAAYRWISVYTRDGVNESSDERLKNNIRKIDSSLLEKAEDIKPIMYEGQNGKTSFGYSAQDVQRTLTKYAYQELGMRESEVLEKFSVLEKGESYLSLRYRDVEVMKGALRDKKIKELENRIKELENAG